MNFRLKHIFYFLLIGFVIADQNQSKKDLIDQALNHATTYYWLAPQYFNIDLGFLTNWFSSKPTLSSNIQGYIIYAYTALIMFTLSSILTELLKPDEK